MGKLTLDNIQFIETYLKNSGINFVDVRMEMTDHIASSIETEIEKGDHRDFYYIFKDFMAVNKKSLLKSLCSSSVLTYFLRRVSSAPRRTVTLAAYEDLKQHKYQSLLACLSICRKSLPVDVPEDGMASSK